MKRFLIFFLLLATVCNAQNPTTVFHGGQGRSSLDSAALLLGANKSAVISLSNSSADSLKFLRANGPNHLPTWETVSGGGSLPSQTGEANKALFTNGTTPFWESIAAYVDAGVGITLSETGTHHVKIDIDTSVINTDDCVITAPASDTRNVIFPPADWIGLTIKSNGVKDILRIKDSSNVILAAFNHEGLILGDVAGAGTAVPLYARQMAGGTTVAALFEKSDAASPNDIIQIADESHNLYGAVTAVGDLHIGDLTSYLSSSHIGTVNVIQKDTNKLAISWKQKNTSGTGVNFLELYNPSDVLITRFSANGDFRSANKGSFGSLLGSGADLHVEEATNKNVHLREVNSGAGITNERRMAHLQTTTNAWNTLCSWTTSPDKCYVVSGHVISRQSTNGNGKFGKGCGGLIFCSFHNITGFGLAVIGAGTSNATQTDLAAGSGVRFNINGNDIELQVDAGAAETVEWDFYDSIFIER